MTETQIKNNLDAGKYKPATPYPTSDAYPKYPANYVFDPNQSVNWNQAEAARLNKLREDAFKIYRADQNDCYKAFMADIKSMLVTEYGLPEKAAEMTANRAYETGHSAGYHEVLLDATDLGQFVSDCIEASK